MILLIHLSQCYYLYLLYIYFFSKQLYLYIVFILSHCYYLYLLYFTLLFRYNFLLYKCNIWMWLRSLNMYFVCNSTRLLDKMILCSNIFSVYKSLYTYSLSNSMCSCLKSLFMCFLCNSMFVFEICVHVFCIQLYALVNEMIFMLDEIIILYLTLVCF